MTKRSRDGSPRNVVIWLLCGGILILAIWFFGTQIVSSSLSSSSTASELGAVGDRFGAVNALFSGLAFLGLIVVLVYEMTERKRDLDHRRDARQPYIAPSLFGDADLIRDGGTTASSGLGARLDDARKSDPGGSARIRFEIRLFNLTDDPALDVGITVTAAGYGDGSGDSRVTMPIGGKESVVTVLELSLSGKGIKKFFDDLEKGFVAKVCVTYGDLRGERWESGVQVKLVPDSKAAGYNLDDIRSVSRGDLNVGKGSDDVLKMDYRCTAEAGTWTQRRES